MFERFEVLGSLADLEQNQQQYVQTKLHNNDYVPIRSDAPAGIRRTAKS
jgi:hypothetical protein